MRIARSTRTTIVVLVLSLAGRTAVAAQNAASHNGPAVGPAHGAVVVVGGGSLGPEIWERFIQLASGPDALIIDVPTAGGDTAYPPDWRGTRGLTAAGAKHVVVLHTIDRKVADSDSFVEPLRHAGGVWFEGGRQYHLVDSYAGTKTEAAFNDVLARGGVVGGSSAGASILGSFLVRGAPSNNNFIIDFPGYETGFGFLRGVGIDQHVVARQRLPDLADSLMPRHPDLLGISEDEGTAWVVRGDTGEIIGRNKAFVYGGRDATDPGKPFLTLFPGDRYDLGARRVLHRAIDDSPLTEAFIDSLFAGYGTAAPAGATVLVAQAGKVLVDRSYGVPPQPKYMPTTTFPNFPLDGVADAYAALAAQLLARDGRLSLDAPLAGGKSVRAWLAGGGADSAGRGALAAAVAATAGTTYPQFVTRRIFTPIGAHRTVVADDGRVESSVDELYRLALGLDGHVFAGDGGDNGAESAPFDAAFGWRADRYRDRARLSAYGAAGGRRNAFVRFPDERVTIIVLTRRDDADARGIGEAIAHRLFGARRTP